MKLRFVFLFVFATGCLGDAALPIISSTRLPGTELSIHLGGPDKKGDFGYYITSTSGVHYGYRPLGRLKSNQKVPATLRTVRDGVFRIQWGSDTSPQFAIIDVKNYLFVDDSNPANPKNQPVGEHRVR